MNQHEELKITGSVNLKVFGEDGQIKEERNIKNLVVTAGKTFIASRIAGTASAVMSHLAIGTGSTAAAIGDTTLGAEAGRVALTSTTPSSNTVVFVATVGAGTGTGAIVEAGLFNASSAGTLLCRTVFSVINKGASDSITATWTLTIS
jgi:hypothetical protein